VAARNGGNHHAPGVIAPTKTKKSLAVLHPDQFLAIWSFSGIGRRKNLEYFNEDLEGFGGKG
jgi:hypothetical protein